MPIDWLKFVRMLPLLVLAACGGGGDTVGSPSPVPNRVVSGYVLDGPIAGSLVRLIDRDSGTLLSLCGESGRGRCETLSRDNGYFYVTLDQDVPLDQVLLTARGGQDQVTGADFSGITQQAGIAAAGGATQGLVISPVSTLLYGEWTRTADPQLAQQRVASWLGFDGAHVLADLSGETRSLQRATLLLSKIALELKREQPSGEPLVSLAAVIDPARPLISGSGQIDLNLLRQPPFELSDVATRRIESLAGILALEGEDLPTLFVEEELFQALSETLSIKLAESGVFDASVPQYLVNGRRLARDLRLAAAAQGQLIALNGVVPQRLVRYALQAYGLAEFSDFVLAPGDFAQRLAASAELPALAANSKIAELAAITAVHSVETPLLTRDLPGDDNLKRLAYYYSSDLSAFYQAEKLVGRVSDDLVNDAILLEIVKGKASQGLFADAEQIIETQIYQSQYKGMGYVWLAYWLNRFGAHDEANRVLLLGHPIYARYFDLIPPSSLSTLDISTLFRYAAHFRKAGNSAGAQAIVEEMVNLSTLNPSAVLAGRLVVQSRDYVAELLADGFQSEARAQIEAMRSFARQTPANQSTTGGVRYEYYKARVFYLAMTATAYADLGDADLVRQVVEEIEALRHADGLSNLTLNETWPYVPELVDDLYRAGYPEQALALAGTIPENYLNYAGASRSGLSYRADAYVTVATHEALLGGYAAGFVVINTHFTTVEDKVDALTYFALNKSAEHVGLALINAGQLAQGVMALDAAVQLLDGFTPGTDADIYKLVIQYGYVKLADLYHLAGDVNRARELLERSLTVAALLENPSLAVDAELDIARGYAGLGDQALAALRLEAASLRAQAGEAELTAEQAAGVYQAIIAAHLELKSGYELGQLIERLLAAADEIFDNARIYTGTAHDNAAKNEISYLSWAGTYQALLGEREAALATFALASRVAQDIFVEATRMDQLCGDPTRINRPGVVGSMTAAGFVDEAIELAEDAAVIPFFASRNQALQMIAQTLMLQDAFPGTVVASVDTDQDGLPDFFSPAVSAADITASGLDLDPDSDGDGLPDTEDVRPLWFDVIQ